MSRKKKILSMHNNQIVKQNYIIKVNLNNCLNITALERKKQSNIAKCNGVIQSAC